MLIDVSSAPCREVTRLIALIVEDDPRLQRAMGKELERKNFEVLSASHFDAAVRHLATRKPHLACVDVGLPSKSGYELCEHIRASPKLGGLPIIVTCDHGDPWAMAHAEDAGADVFLRKPFSMHDLIGCVEGLLVGTVVDGGALQRGRVSYVSRPA